MKWLEMVTDMEINKKNGFLSGQWIKWYATWNKRRRG